MSRQVKLPVVLFAVSSFICFLTLAVSEIALCNRIEHGWYEPILLLLAYFTAVSAYTIAEKDKPEKRQL